MSFCCCGADYCRFDFISFNLLLPTFCVCWFSHLTLSLIGRTAAACAVILFYFFFSNFSTGFTWYLQSKQTNKQRRIIFFFFLLLFKQNLLCVTDKQCVFIKASGNSRTDRLTLLLHSSVFLPAFLVSFEKYNHRHHNWTCDFVQFPVVRPFS